MFEEQPTIVSTDSPQSNNSSSLEPDGSKKKIILIGILMIVVLILVAAGFYIYQKYRPTKNLVDDSINENVLSTSSQPTLPNLDLPLNATSTSASSTFSNLPIEYMSFADFYEPQSTRISPQFKDYKLPINIKIDVMNYYDISRKLSLDASLNDLNNNGFATIDNPWPKEAPDFYAVYKNLDEKQIPILVTSDFIIYYYQNIIKKAFKDIEENVFYDNLWSLNKEMYTAAKNRYEAHLAQIGNVNDSILEGERLETAFFAVALELLKPKPEQLAVKGSLDDKTKFVQGEAERFNFTVPPYLREDVNREVTLIRAAKEKTKSPVMLYSRDYRNFSVPVDYQTNAKLSNFYLTNKWLNSVWPLNYRAKDCATCLLDKDDWRVNLIAASYISQDFTNLPELKNKWARIYKIIAFFKGLRDDLNYVHYRDSLSSTFGANYNIAELFGDQNKDAFKNLEKLRTTLLNYNLPAIQGAYDKNDPEFKPVIGFKMLAESYWPNDYIFSRLTAPAVTNYLGTSTKATNVTTCQLDNVGRRCNGMALDTINLVYPIFNHAYFDENTNYLNYAREADALRKEVNRNSVWHTTNYWNTLGLAKTVVEIDKNTWPLFGRSNAWRDKSLNTAAAAWVNLQLPLEKFSVQTLFRGQGLSSFASWSDSSYVEPNLGLLDELIASNNMLLKMLAALRINDDVNFVSQNIQAANNNLMALRRVVSKEVGGEDLAKEDNEVIFDFIKQLKIDSVAPSNRQIFLKSSKQKTGLREDLNRLKLLVLIHGSQEEKFFSVGPVWDYQEGR